MDGRFDALATCHLEGLRALAYERVAHGRYENSALETSTRSSGVCSHSTVL